MHFISIRNKLNFNIMKTINGATLRKMFTNAFSLVEENKQTMSVRVFSDYKIIRYTVCAGGGMKI